MVIHDEVEYLCCPGYRAACTPDGLLCSERQCASHARGGTGGFGPVGQAGYRPRKMSYPADIQAAEARLNAQDGAASNNSGMGGVANGSSQMRAPATTKMGADPLYSHH